MLIVFRDPAIFAEHALAHAAYSLDGPLGPLVVRVGGEADANTEERFEGVPEQQILALGVYGGTLMRRRVPSAADLNAPVFGQIVVDASHADRAGCREVNDCKVVLVARRLAAEPQLQNRSHVLFGGGPRVCQSAPKVVVLAGIEERLGVAQRKRLQADVEAFEHKVAWGEVL